MFTLKHPLRLIWRQVYRQFGVDPAKASDNQTVQDFRYKVLRELKKIKLAWPELHYSRPCCMDHPEGCLIIVFFNTGDNLDAT